MSRLFQDAEASCDKKICDGRTMTQEPKLRGTARHRSGSVAAVSLGLAQFCRRWSPQENCSEVLCLFVWVPVLVYN